MINIKRGSIPDILSDSSSRGIRYNRHKKLDQPPIEIRIPIGSEIY